ncbi:hypothetical protein ABEB36_010127 [Hypothenemus hampei]|uniref:Uncharacterized protein n=1 Tax=Hypothenemus hampei TaxID=57062 RepID=A0ABD1EIU6_HYPHA
MGNSPKKSNSVFHLDLYLRQINKIIEEKHNVYIALQTDIKVAIDANKINDLKILVSEIIAHLIDLKQVKWNELPSMERGRVEKLVHNFEISLATVKSALQHLEKIEDEPLYANSEVGQTEAVDALLCIQSDADNDSLADYRNEFEMLQNKFARPITDVVEYCQIDKGAFYLQVQLNELVSLPLNEELLRTQLLTDLTAFRSRVEQEYKSFEEELEFKREIINLEVTLDGVINRDDLASLRSRGVALSEAISKREHWTDGNKKNDLLERLHKVLAFEPEFNSSRNKITRDTVYENLDVIKKTNVVNSVPVAMPQKVPRPLPRKHMDKYVFNIPRNWERLDMILDQVESGALLDQTQLNEIEEIKTQKDIVMELFKKKIDRIMEKNMDNVNL